jgi:hypothetical protein
MSKADSTRLVEKYKPKTLADLWGQSWVADQLRAWLESPVPTAFLFAGGTGTGKTSAALALARDLGAVVEEGEFGGLHQITSGEQTGQTVREAMRRLALRPFLGAGWQILIVNEADAMTPNAAYVWLDALETLPPRSAVIFTTNTAGKLPRRLVDRCERFDFLSGALLLRPDLEAFARVVWQNETGRDDCPDIDSLGPVADENGDASFRRLLQNLEPAVRAVKSGITARPRMNPTILPMRGRSGAAHKAWATRRANQRKKVNCG